MATASDFEILAAIDLRGGRVVRLEQGDFSRETAFAADPAEVAVGFVEAGVRWLHVVDLDGARTGVPAHGRAIAAIVQSVGARAAVEVAGGLRDDASVATALDAGAARVIVGTAALAAPGFGARLVARYGPAAVGVAIDVRDGRAVGHGWVADRSGPDAVEAIARLADAGIETFEVTAIDRDGLLGGPDLDLYRRVVATERGRVIGSGGVGTLGDVRALRRAGCAGVIVGRALYAGWLDVAGLLVVAAESGVDPDPDGA